MFKGIRYRLTGFRNSTLVVDHVDVHKNGLGIATIAHTSFSPVQQAGMARRILAAMNLTQNMTLTALEAAAASPFPDPEALAGPLTDAQRRQARELLGNLAAGSSAFDDIVRAIAAMGYLNGLRDAPPRAGKQVAWMCPRDPDANSAFSWGGWKDVPQPAPVCSCCREAKVPVWISTGT